MPRGDRTGPAGVGPMTGRGVGYCADYETPGAGRGRGWWGPAPVGPGRGRGWRHWYHATGLPRWARYGPYGPALAEEQEVDLLKEQAEALKGRLEAITQRLEELEKKEE